VSVPLGTTNHNLTGSNLIDALTTDYCAGGHIVYEDSVLAYILHPEGLLKRSASGKYSYYYYLRDHLGNNRVVLQMLNSGFSSSDYVISQETNYYPFGMPYPEGFYGDSYNPQAQPYKFGGKELDEMHGLKWYDQGARPFGTVIPVTPTPDPLQEKYYSVSQYSQYGNNPVNRIDPDGREWKTKEDEEYAKKLSQAMTNKATSEQRSLDRLNAKIAKNEAKGKDVSKDQAKAAGKQANIDNLNAGVSELTEMGATPDQVFTYNMTNEEGGKTTIEDGVIVMKIIGNGNIANGIHESSHGYDVFKSGMPKKVDDFYATETKAYGRQFSYGGSSVMPYSDWGRVNSLGDVITPWVTGITNSTGDYMYGQQILGAKYNKALIRSLLNEYKKK
jgi:RHS repeat-associated protein